MTSPTSATCSSRRSSRRAFRTGFTLVEMLVVIGIIILVLGIAGPALTRAWRAGDRASTFADIQAISVALDAYRADHGDYPRVFAAPKPIDDKFNGARMLCRALIGPGPGVLSASPAPTAPDSPKIPDGAGISPKAGDPETLPGPGFRVRGSQGKVYGPYLQMNRFKLGDPNTDPPRTNVDPGYFAILDRYGRPFLYYPGLGKPNIRSANGFVGDYDPKNPPDNIRPLYNARDNSGPMKKDVFMKMMGDMNANGMIDGAETAAYEGPYLIWSGGADESFGPSGAEAPPKTNPPTPPGPEDYPACDDITNFRK